MMTITTKILTSTTMVGDDDADTDNVDDNDCLLWQRSLNYNANTMMDDWWWLNVANTNLAVGTSSEPMRVRVSTLVPRAEHGCCVCPFVTGQGADGLVHRTVSGGLKLKVVVVVVSMGADVIVRRAGLLWSQQDFEWRWSVPLFKCLTVLEFSFILFDLCLLITFFNFIMNYVPIVTFWIFTYHKIWILSIMFCSIWSYWIIYFLACLEVSWRVVS